MKDREQAREQLRADVALMRSLGVARWTRGEEDIFLGPPPSPEPQELTVEEEIARRDREAIQRHETLFAATSIRPKLAEAEQGRRASVLKSVVPRPAPQEHDSGPPKQAKQQ